MKYFKLSLGYTEDEERVRTPIVTGYEMEDRSGGIVNIPEDPLNKEYIQMMEEVELGTSEIIDKPLDHVPTWSDKRREKVASGGYGTWQEQMEIIGEQGIDAFQEHIQTVKAAIPKP